jgi:hypothetical protein
LVDFCKCTNVASKTGALSKEDISIVSPKTVKTSNRKPVRAAAAAASTRFQENYSSDFGEARKRRSNKNKLKPTKWVPPEEDEKPKWKTPPAPAQALAMTDVGLNLDGVTKKNGKFMAGGFGYIMSHDLQ